MFFKKKRFFARAFFSFKVKMFLSETLCFVLGLYKAVGTRCNFFSHSQCNFCFFVALPARGKSTACIMPATLTAKMSGNAKNCCRKSKSFNFSLQHFQDCTSKISENWKLQRLSLMFTNNAIILFKLAKTTQTVTAVI